MQIYAERILSLMSIEIVRKVMHWYTIRECNKFKQKAPRNCGNCVAILAYECARCTIMRYYNVASTRVRAHSNQD